ncbi:hypothetical protein BHM03_00007153, partial [Ensete ventricosum]
MSAFHLQVIGIVSVSLLPVESITDISLIYFDGLLKVIKSKGCIRQTSSSVNKPRLPLASGEFSMEIGTAIVALCCVLDIPDVDGDRDFGIRSFSVRLGQEKVKSVLAVHQVTSNSIYRSPCGRSFIIKHISEETSD